MADITDDELLAMYSDGDAEAFDTLFDRYRAPVYNFAHLMLGRADGAEDMLQETFMAVARTAERYQPHGHFRSWLMRIVRNRCLNELEARRVRRRMAARSGLDLAEPPADGPSPPERLERSEQMARLRDLIAALPERQREAIVLYAFEQMSYREIGDVLGVPVNTVKTLIHRARATLALDFG